MSEAKPRRIQLSRRKGFRLQEHSRAVNGLECVKVDRATCWGNPFKVGDFGIPDAAAAVQRFREWYDGRVVGPERPPLDALRGKNLACWCPLNAACHATVLLELANAPTAAMTKEVEG